jgi:predicted transcriptional regulator
MKERAVNGLLGSGLSKRERQIMEAVFRRKKATAFQVQEAMPEPPSYSAVRATLQVRVDKGLLAYRREGRRYLYAPTISHRRAALSAARHLLSTYFENSIAAALTAMLQADRKKLEDVDYQRLLELIREAEKGGRS